MRRTLILYSVVISLISCKKDDKACWQAFDKGGADATGLILCDKTRAEAEAAYPSYWFYKVGETKYCWKLQNSNGVSYGWDIPQSMADSMHKFWGFTFTRMDCSSFCFLEWNEKHKSKITGMYGPTYTKQEYLFSSDTCSKLSVGKIVVIKDTMDSLVTKELVRKEP